MGTCKIGYPKLFWIRIILRPYGKIWTKSKEKNTEKRLDHRKGEDGRAFLFCCRPSRLRRSVHLYVKCIFSDVSGILYRFGILDHIGPFCTILDHPETFQTIFDRFKIALYNFQTILDHFRPYWTISDHHGPFQTILDHLGQSWTMAQFQRIPGHFRPL